MLHCNRAAIAAIIKLIFTLLLSDSFQKLFFSYCCSSLAEDGVPTCLVRKHIFIQKEEDCIQQMTLVK